MRPRKRTTGKQKPGIHPLKTTQMGERIRFLREVQGLSQGDVERATGLLRCYTSRVEHGHTVPSLETMERFASALGVPMYLLFCTGDESALSDGGLFPGAPAASERGGGRGKSPTAIFAKLRGMLSRIAVEDRQLLMGLAEELAARGTAAESEGRSRRKR